MTFRDLEILDVSPHFDSVVAGAMDDLRLDTKGYGLSTPWRETGAVRRTIKLPVLLTSMEDIGAYRRFWDRHRGRQVPFWVPAWLNDFPLVADASADGAEISVEGHAFSEKYALGGQYKFIALLTRAGKLECYGVTAVDDSGDDDVLTLDRGLVTDLVAGVTICCPCLLVRPIKDDLEIEYRSGGMATTAIEVVELPHEYPAPAADSSAEDTAHYGSRPVVLYRLTDGETTLLLADYGVDVEVASLTWQAADISGEDLVSALDMLGDTMSVTLRTDDAGHPLLDLMDPLQARNYSIEVFMADLDDLESFDISSPMHVGRVEEIGFGENGALNLTVSSLFRVGEQKMPRFQLQRLANRSVYDYVDEGTYKTTGTIDALSASPAYVEASEFGDKATAESDPNWFALGRVTTGTEVRMCTGQDGNKLYLNYPFRRAEAGDSVSALAGDDKRIATWAVKFGELDNFPGFPYIPARNPQYKALETPKPSGGKKG